MVWRGDRREFLTLLVTAGALTALGIEKLSKLFTQNNEYLSLVTNSIKKGKALEDINEILRSRLIPDRRVLTLGESIKGYSESWMHVVSNQIETRRINETSECMQIIDVTDSVKPVNLPNEKKLRAKVNGSGQVLNIEKYRLDEVMQLMPGITLPIPQFVSGLDYQEHDDTTTIADYNYYRLYAGFRLQDGSWSTESSLNNKPSNKRGGLILTQDNHLIVATPDEFVTFEQNRDKLLAQMEYAYIIDSATLEKDLDLLASLNHSKNYAMSSEYANTIVTFYKSDGNIETKVFSLISLFDEQNLKFENQSNPINLTQFSLLINEYAREHEFSRFVMVMPDTGGYSVIQTPLNYPYQLAREKMPNAIANWEIDPASYATDSEYPNLYRTLGIGANNLRPNVAQFPTMLISNV